MQPHLRSSLLMAAALFMGCSSSDEPVGYVKGRVTHKGQPVTSGSVTFSPIGATAKEPRAGKAAAGTLDANGEFELSTFDIGDGAVTGRHHVVLSPEAIEKPLPKGKLTPSEVEVKEGSNELSFEIQP